MGPCVCMCVCMSACMYVVADLSCEIEGLHARAAGERGACPSRSWFIVFMAMLSSPFSTAPSAGTGTRRAPTWPAPRHSPGGTVAQRPRGTCLPYVQTPGMALRMRALLAKRSDSSTQRSLNLDYQRGTRRDWQLRPSAFGHGTIETSPQRFRTLQNSKNGYCTTGGPCCLVSGDR